MGVKRHPRSRQGVWQWSERGLEEVTLDFSTSWCKRSSKRTVESGYTDALHGAIGVSMSGFYCECSQKLFTYLVEA